MNATSGPSSSLVPCSAPCRRTLAGRAEIRGVGLFTGRPCTLTIAPAIPVPSSHALTSTGSSAAPPGPGVCFRRVDLPGAPLIPATIQHVVPDRRRTVLARDAGLDGPRAEAHTVEHVLSALAGLGVTDAVLELDGPEIPIGDGSATPFVRAIQSAGVRDLDPADFPLLVPVTVRQPMVVSDLTRGEIRAFPTDSPGCEMIYQLDYGPAAPIAPQSATLHVEPGAGVPAYASELAGARTFCLMQEAIALREMGLFGGFEPKDLLVIGPDGPIDNSYRFSNEPARHKLLDMLGDLSLVGRPIQARIVATRSGHALNHQMAAALASLV